MSPGFLFVIVRLPSCRLFQRGRNPQAIAWRNYKLMRLRIHPAARAITLDREPCVPRATTYGEFVAEYLRERQKRFGRGAHNRPDVG